VVADGERAVDGRADLGVGRRAGVAALVDQRLVQQFAGVQTVGQQPERREEL
jgi:hypothetical protein